MVWRLLYIWGMMRKIRAVSMASRTSSLSSTDMARAKWEPSLFLLCLYSFLARGPKSFLSTMPINGASR